MAYLPFTGILERTAIDIHIRIRLTTSRIVDTSRIVEKSEAAAPAVDISPETNAIRKAEAGLVTQVGHRTASPDRGAGNVLNTVLRDINETMKRVRTSPEETDIATAASVRYGLSTRPKYSFGARTNAGP